MSSPATWLRTLWYLRPEQLRGQLLRAVAGEPKPRRAGGPPAELALGAAAVPFLGPPAHLHATPQGELRLLNRSVQFRDGVDWEHAEQGPLWAYHLHEMRWLQSPALGPGPRLAFVLDWIQRHTRGTGWHGGPISLRCFAWTRLLLTPGALPAEPATRARIAASLADQLATLAARPERHLLGNHYLWNLLALVLGGLVLRGSEAERWCGQAGVLREELARQLGADGAHEERSPMYHALLLESLLDLVNVARAAGAHAPGGLLEALRGHAARMLGALDVFTHPDGEIALLGDSALRIAPPPAALREYATSLGVEAQAPKDPGVLRDGGVVRLAAGGFSLLASVAGPSPPHQPGHAHCDALGFELCVFGERVVTDTGVYEYLPGERRTQARATGSHATLEVEGHEQAEVWAAHRVGGRPDVALVSVEPPHAAEAVCAGWSTPELLHRRRFRVEADAVSIEDVLTGPELPVRLHLPLAPGLEPELDGARARLRLKGGRTLELALPETASWSLRELPYYPEFGRELRRVALLGRAPALREARWRIVLA